MRSKAETESDKVRGYSASNPAAVLSRGKIRIVIAGLRGEDSIAELCRKEGIDQNLYYLLPFVE